MLIIWSIATVSEERDFAWIDHYLDNFITMGPLGPQVCGRNLDIIFRACEELDVPLAMKKSDSPTTRLIFLGIKIDTTSGSIRNHKKASSPPPSTPNRNQSVGCLQIKHCHQGSGSQALSCLCYFSTDVYWMEQKCESIPMLTLPPSSCQVHFQIPINDFRVRFHSWHALAVWL